MKNSRFLLAVIICFYFFSPGFAFAGNLAGYASISGYVQDSITDRPINNARIIIRCGSKRLKTTSDSLGYYLLKVPIYRKKNRLINSALIKITAKKYISIRNHKALFPDQVYVMDFKLKTRFKWPIVKGRVFDASSNVGISSAEVIATRKKKVFTAVTDKEGNYILRIRTRRARKYSIVAKADEHYESFPEILKVFPYHTYNLDFPLDIMALGVSVSPDNWHIGNLGLNSVAVMTQGQQIIVTNTGSNNQTYSLMVVSPQGWIASRFEVGAEQYILNACFSSDISSISWNDQSHSLLETLQRCSEIKFAGDQNGVNILPGGQRTLWMQFKAPIRTNKKNEQVMQVIINAEIP